LRSDSTEKWLSHLKTLVQALDLVDPNLMPPSFKADILDPIRDNQTLLDRLSLRNTTYDLICNISDISDVAKTRHWFFWEKASRAFARYIRADSCLFYRQGLNGCLNQIHPLDGDDRETDEKEFYWPISERGDLALLEEPLFQQCFLLRIGLNHPIILKFQSRLKTPAMHRARLDELQALSRLLYNILAKHLPTMDTKGLTPIEAAPPDNENVSQIFGKDPGLLNAIQSAENAADSEATVYFQGESGTGKELFAKHLHHLSARGQGPFIPINCSAIPQELIESEMFGHEKGAFTGAYYRKIGKAEQAHGGTLFLDEIGEMPLPFQAKLLRFLQEKRFTRVGGNNPITSDARIVVATHRDLKEMVREGKFREDLFYRVHVIQIQIPPLRDRGRDIRCLAEIFFKKFISKSRASRRIVDETVFDVLERYAFPGNVRELENIIQRTVVMTQNSLISAEDLPSELFKCHEDDAPHSFQLHPFERLDGYIPHDRDSLKAIKKEVEFVATSYQRDLERRFLLGLLEKAGGSARKAAEMASINRTLFYKLLKRAGLDIGLINKEDL